MKGLTSWEFKIVWLGFCDQACESHFFTTENSVVQEKVFARFSARHNTSVFLRIKKSVVWEKVWLDFLHEIRENVCFVLKFL